MNGIVRAAFRLTAFKNLAAPINSFGKREFTRTLGHMSKTPEKLSIASTLSIHKPSLSCSCGCNVQHMHTKGEKELVEFLAEEIVAEKKTQTGKIPTEIDGFKLKLDGAEVELIKESDKEKIVVSFNINHTVDSEDAENDAGMEETQKSEMSTMRSKPNFEVDIIRKDNILSFTCAFLQGPVGEGEYDDVFGIEEITMYKGEWTDKNYAVAGEVLDGYLYDLLMNLLEEKGISNDFANKIADLSTLYEHSSYIGLLEALSKFTIPK